jgi:hypothetical protein
MTSPSAASRTSFEVLMCSSRTDVVRMYHIVALAAHDTRPGEPALAG